MRNATAATPERATSDPRQPVESEPIEQPRAIEPDASLAALSVAAAISGHTAAAAAPAKGADAAETNPGALPRPKVLIVDDQDEGLFTLEATLKSLDADVVAVRSGPEALSRMFEEEFAAVLLDVSMPDMDGFEVASQMQAAVFTRNIPVLMVTAINRDERSMLRGYTNGAVDFLYKPYHPKIVRSKVEVFLNLYRQRKAQEEMNRRLAALQDELIQKRMEAEAAATEIARQKSEIERHNTELIHRNQELDSFAHVISHDLRRPLQSMIDYLELTDVHREGSVSDVSRWIESAKRLGRNMQGLIGDFLEYATAAQTPALGAADCNIALAMSLDNLSAALRESEARVACDTLPRVLGAEKRLARLFQNLISNAIQYRSSAPLVIQVRADWDDARRNWVLRVIDNGRGIREADRDRIFEMFARAANTGAVAGCGIGLAVCKKIVESHGGRIWVESEPGKGSQFCFTLRPLENL